MHEVTDSECAVDSVNTGLFVCVQCLLCLEMVGGSRSTVGNGTDAEDWIFSGEWTGIGRWGD